ncbi:hypothetical protein PAF17_19835 [Paracoccus sp. Z330]|uniref:Uncharacterized protein n=1 Tax=Paracoccus onchidii TaxID=3017813 RepID=A0ABT4ZKU1_9RHOB|nr:hypothetical protein [Paracoccus onchidii]MDB6179702.1 hypothetical protein [Paracoccus onchidii]
MVFAALYLAALCLLAIGTFGLFGQESDPLSAVFLIPMGLPWVMFLDNLPEALRMTSAILAPLLNLVLIATICKILGKSRK